MFKFLIIQTAFTGDVVLATAIAEKLHAAYPQSPIDFLVRKGNEGLLQGHPYIREVLVWDKKQNKNRNLLAIAMRVRRARYSHVINPHRFATSGIITFLSGAKVKAGFTQNPFSFCYTRKVPHVISAVTDEKPVHEVTRNQQLIADITDGEPAMPALYPSAADYAQVKQYQAQTYICVAPSSVWFTKQFPAEKWAQLISVLPANYTVYLIGAPSDTGTAREIIAQSTNPKVQDLCGKLSFLQSAALMQGAIMNYANDSAPLHFASAMNAPLTAVYCSTTPAFGFGPLRGNARVVQIQEALPCRPCGLHGHKACPEKHFKCAYEISNNQLLWWTSKTT
jgi:heptosyltransferase II